MDTSDASAAPSNAPLPSDDAGAAVNPAPMEAQQSDTMDVSMAETAASLDQFAAPPTTTGAASSVPAVAAGAAAAAAVVAEMDARSASLGLRKRKQINYYDDPARRAAGGAGGSAGGEGGGARKSGRAKTPSAKKKEAERKRTPSGAPGDMGDHVEKKWSGGAMDSIPDKVLKATAGEKRSPNKRRRKDKDSEFTADHLEDDDETRPANMSVDEYKATMLATLPERASSRRSRQSTRRVYQELDSDDDEFIMSEDEAERVRRNKKKRKKAKAKKASKAAGAVAAVSDESDDDDDDDDEVKVEKIVVEKIIGMRYIPPFHDEGHIEYFVKWRGRAYIHCEWVKPDVIIGEGPHGKGKILRYRRRYPEMIEEPPEGWYNEEFVTVDRIVAEREITLLEETEIWVKPDWEPSHGDPGYASIADMNKATVEEVKEAAAEEVEEKKNGGAEENGTAQNGTPTTTTTTTMSAEAVAAAAADLDTSDATHAANVVLTTEVPTAPPVGTPPGPDEPRKKGLVWREKQFHQYLVKWRSLNYSEATWEMATDINDDAKLAEYRRFNTIPEESMRKSLPRPVPTAFQRIEECPEFKGGHRLRDYQLEGLNWMVFSWYQRRNCILADEMGLGKTVQTVSVVEYLRRFEGQRGPFLIVAPLSTLGHWQREFEGWTDMNAIVYHGSADARSVIHEHEWVHLDDDGNVVGGTYKFDAIITTYEMIKAEFDVLVRIHWKFLAVDEAHRLKNRDSVTSRLLREFRSDYMLLLTGTPLQNNTQELHALLSFIAPKSFGTEEWFLSQFGDLKDSSQVERLHAMLKPFLLRRMKEDVEKSIAPKEETIIDVELCALQKKTYRAILEGNFAFLQKGSKASNVPSLMNIMMELRKCCNHPYLNNGIEEAFTSSLKSEAEHLEAMVQASGKLILIDKLLPKLREGGHKVLIFSQMVRVLDILEDYCHFRTFSYERLDGRIRGNERQQAIDRFNSKYYDKFVFLLCTRAGGLGLNLQAADTVIIYDSDWNPQNDIQAQARCHRIGQDKSVKVYRLLTRNTYERQMFERASMKLGLDQAVLHSMRGGEAGRKAKEKTAEGKTDKPIDKDEINALLKYGAYDLFNEKGDEATKRFNEESIDSILSRAEVRREGGNTGDAPVKGSTFSKVSFDAATTGPQLDLNDPDFWAKVIPEHQRIKEEPTMDYPRARRQVKRYGVEAGLSEDEWEDGEDESRPTPTNPTGGRDWTKGEIDDFQRALLCFGWGRWEAIQKMSKLTHRGYDALEHMAIQIVAETAKHVTSHHRVVEVALQRFSELLRLAKQQQEERKRKLEQKKAERAKSGDGGSGSEGEGEEGEAALKDEPMEDADSAVKAEAVEDADAATATTTDNDDAAKDGAAEDMLSGMDEVPVHDLLKEETMAESIRRSSRSTLRRLDSLMVLADKVNKCADKEYADMELPDLAEATKKNGKPADWWGETEDRHLMVGVFRHGLYRYAPIRHDADLVFRQLFGSRPRTKLRDGEDDGEGGEMDAAAIKAAGSKSKTVENDGYVWPSTKALNQRFNAIIKIWMKERAKEVKEQTKMRRFAERMKAKEEKRRVEKEMRLAKKMAAQAEWNKRERMDLHRALLQWGLPAQLEGDALKAREVREAEKLQEIANAASGESPLAIGRGPYKGQCINGRDYSTLDWESMVQHAMLGRKTGPLVCEFFTEVMNECERVVDAKLGHKLEARPTNVHDDGAIPLAAPAGGGSGGDEGDEKSKKKKKEEAAAAAKEKDGKPARRHAWVSYNIAKKLIRRLDVLEHTRRFALTHPKLDDVLPQLKRRAKEELPSWWVPGEHDRALLRGVAKYGFNIQGMCTDGELPFAAVHDKLEGALAAKAGGGQGAGGDKGAEGKADGDVKMEDTADGAAAGGDKDGGDKDGEKKKSSSPSVGGGGKVTIKTMKNGIEPEGFAFPRERGMTSRLYYLFVWLANAERGILGVIPPPPHLTMGMKLEGNHKRLFDEEEGAEDAVRKPKKERMKKKPGYLYPKKVKEVSRRADGTVRLPVELGILRLLDTGRVVVDNPYFHSKQYIFPVGYKVSREYASMRNPHKRIAYFCSVEERGGQPLYVIEPEDESGRRIEARTSTNAWTQIVKVVNDLRTEETGKRKFTSVSGPEYFGFSNPTIQMVLQELPDVDKLENYIMQKFTMPGETPVPIGKEPLPSRRVSAKRGAGSNGADYMDSLLDREDEEEMSDEDDESDDDDDEEEGMSGDESGDDDGEESDDVDGVAGGGLKRKRDGGDGGEPATKHIKTE